MTDGYGFETEAGARGAMEPLRDVRRSLLKPYVKEEDDPDADEERLGEILDELAEAATASMHRRLLERGTGGLLTWEGDRIVRVRAEEDEVRRREAATEAETRRRLRALTARLGDLAGAGDAAVAQRAALPGSGTTAGDGGAREGAGCGEGAGRGRAGKGEAAGGSTAVVKARTKR